MIRIVVAFSIVLAIVPLGTAADSARCANHGTMVNVGTYSCDGPCENHGVLVWVGKTCHHPGLVGACEGPHCAAIGDETTSA